jgi:hypothetical protein
MTRRLRLTIIGLRLAAVALMIASTYLLWTLMLGLPWQADCVIAAVAAAAFAYKFERTDQ